MIDWVTHNLISLGQFVTAVGTIVGVVGGLWLKNKRNDNSTQKYIIDTVRQENQTQHAEIKQAKHDYQDYANCMRLLYASLTNKLG